ncbi:MAG: IS21 family transposase [Eubacteriales bacterium]|nr:IS21 family transposase [Eubacteriales bacterium]
MQKYATIIGVVELRLQKVGYATTQKRYGIGSSTVTLIMKRFRELGLSLEELKAMSPKAVETAFYPPENMQRSEKPLPDFDQIHARIAAMEHPNLAFLWMEYKDKNPNGYQLSQFYELYRTFLSENFGQEKVTMPVERIPGERMYIDWVGDQPELLTDPATGEIRKVHIFTTTLGFSSLVYAEIFPDEKLPHFISGVVNALKFYQAVPKYLVPDNLKTAITKHSKDELLLNAVFSDLEDFYDTIVLPPPPRKPKGKPTVENHVRFLETHLVERLKEKIFTSIEAMNLETQKIIADINQRDFRNRKDIRRSRQYAFETYDKPRMRPLPPGGFTSCDYRYFLRIPDNYHLEYDGHYYSVLYTYHGKPAMLKATMSEIRICDENNRLICTHARSYRDFPRYITDDTHMPPEHQYYKELNAHDGAYYRRWASVYGEAMSTFIDRMLRSVKHEEQAYNSCKGILHTCQDVPRHIVEEAAQFCIDASACRYTYFKKALSRMMDHSSLQKRSTDGLPEHENIRGRDSYQ